MWRFENTRLLLNSLSLCERLKFRYTGKVHYCSVDYLISLLYG